MYEKHFYLKMLITFEPNVAQRSVASQNDHKSKACLPEASNTAFTMYRRLKRRLRRLYEAPFFGASTTLASTSVMCGEFFLDFLFYMVCIYFSVDILEVLIIFSYHLIYK